MKAAVIEQYGSPDVVKLKEIITPTPRDNELLIKVNASTVSSADWRIRSLTVPAGFGLLVRLAFGVLKPRKSVLGTELAGEVVGIGKNITQFKPGDEIFAHPGSQLGAHAEYISLREDSPIALKPASLSFEEAAALSFGGVTALDFLQNKAKIRNGEKVLINGASGAVGTAAVQLAKYFGAEVTGVCSCANMKLVRSIGADRVIDYTREDFMRSGETWDIIMDTVGNLPLSRIKNALTVSGRALLVVADLWNTLRAPLLSRAGGRQYIAGSTRERSEDLTLLAGLAESGQYKPVIDRCYPFQQIAEAHAYVDTGRKRGSVVIIIHTAM
ncbi:MAG: NAD(P)-dependent alcohol dehydrogenase [Granulosicoccus sp.]